MNPTLTLAAVLAAVAIATPSAAAREYRYVDAHLHYVDFFQESDGMPALLKNMDRAGIDSVVLMGIPVTKKWHEDEPQRPRYFQGDDAPLYWYSATDLLVADAVQKLDPAQRARIHPFLSGFNPNDKNATVHIEHMLRIFPGLWQGIGEVFTRHDDLTAMIHGDVPRANNEAMQRVYRLAARHDLPVLLHANLASVREREPLYLGELEQALADNPRTRFIWAHAGMSAEINRVQGREDYLLPTLRKLLKEHANLWIDLSWAVLDPYVLDRHGQPRAAWLALIGAHPDRFVIGSDLVGRFDNVGSNLHAFDPLLDALPVDTARKLAHDNLLALLPAHATRPDGAR